MPHEPPQQQAAGADADTPSSTAPSSTSNRCRFFMARKQRCCGWPALKGGQFCGNHSYEATGAGEARVPCPANAKHLVAVSQLATHLPKCPDAVYQAAIRAQPCFSENLNAGADASYGLQDLQGRVEAAAAAIAAAAATAAAVAATGDTAAGCMSSEEAAQGAATAAAAAAGLIPSDPDAAAVAAEATASFLRGTAAERQAAAVALGPDGFAALLAKIETAHAALTAAYPLHTRTPCGGGGDAAAAADALQARCKAFDKLMPFDAKHTLQNACIVGNMSAAGLLQQADHAVYVELGAGKAWLTAWLHMLHPSTRHFVLLDKVGNFSNKADRRLRHTNLTRVAVDLKDAALLPLLQQHMSAAAAAAAAQAVEPSVDSPGDGGGSGGLHSMPHEHQQEQLHGAQHEQQQSVAQGVVPWVVLGKHLCGAATDFALRACLNTLLSPPVVATNQQQQQQFELRGLAIASCCHHRCGWMAYTGREALASAAGITKADFEVIAWLTGWALCGHEAAPGAAAAGGDADADAGSRPAEAPGTTGQQQSQQACGECCSSCGDCAGQQPSETRPSPGWHPAQTLSHQQRIQLGLKCKQLLDAGRCAWLQEQLAPRLAEVATQPQLQVQRVAYIDAAVTGENTLLLVGRL